MSSISPTSLLTDYCITTSPLSRLLHTLLTFYVKHTHTHTLLSHLMLSQQQIKAIQSRMTHVC